MFEHQRSFRERVGSSAEEDRLNTLNKTHLPAPFSRLSIIMIGIIKKGVMSEVQEEERMKSTCSPHPSPLNALDNRLCRKLEQ